MSAGPVFFRDAAAFGAWLAMHSTSADDLVVGFYKVGSGKPSLTWPQSVDEALCVGWIDGVRKGIDSERYQIRFSRRRAGSTWSAINIARVAVLAAEGRMKKEGLAAFERRVEAKSRIYSYEREHPAELDASELREFKRHEAAWAFFEATPKGDQRRHCHWVASAKRPETRVRRFEKLLAACACWEELRR